MPSAMAVFTLKLKSTFVSTGSPAFHAARFGRPYRRALTRCLHTRGGRHVRTLSRRRHGIYSFKTTFNLRASEQFAKRCLSIIERQCSQVGTIW
jgi:hypothetical protein